MSETERKVAIITDDPGWHGEQLKLSLKKYGLKSSYFSLCDFLIEIDKKNSSIEFPGFNGLPSGIFVRGVPGGTLEQVIFRLDILHALQDLGVAVYNSPRAIERTVDKTLTSILLAHAGLPTPKTWVCESKYKANKIIERECISNKKIVLKPLFGSQGIGIHLINHTQGLIHDEKFAGVYYLQEYIERKNTNFSDIRVLVVDGEAKAAMSRHGHNWVTNRAQGAICKFLELNKEISSLSEAACNVLNIDYAGVDLIEDKDGQLNIIEVNSIPAWYGLQKVVNFNIADCLIESFVKNITNKNSRSVYAN